MPFALKSIALRNLYIAYKNYNTTLLLTKEA